MLGDSSRWSLIVVSDLIPEHRYLPSSILAVSAHLHIHSAVHLVRAQLSHKRLGENCRARQLFSEIKANRCEKCHTSEAHQRGCAMIGLRLA